MAGFDRLTAALQYQIVNTLGYRELRPVQELTIGPVLDGMNCVVLAPTAGGKTEAAFFPVLSAMDAADWRPTSVLYLSPIRALLNNQLDRVTRFAQTLGRRVALWHGDTGQGARKAFLREPADILLTTPESLEAMMMSPRVPSARVFAGLRAVIIDEVHAFAGDDRGAHLAALLERLSRFCGSDVQRIGLSATVGNPEQILKWLQGGSQRPGVVLSPPRPDSAVRLALDFVETSENAASVIRRLHPGTKRLVFVDSRRGVEEIGVRLRAAGVDVHMVHGSLSAAERRDAERAFAERTDCVIVSTSALELGIDIGDLDHVIQIDSPGTVASFLQRLGRTGRRAGAVANCTFLAVKPSAALQAAALMRLHRQGYVEHVRPSRRAAHILAHQLLALCVEHRGVGRGDWFAWLAGATSFADIRPEERSAIVDHMLASGILSHQDGRLWLGPRGEKLYGRRNFAELYAVFSTPALIRVQHGAHEVGTVDASFLEALDSDARRATFSLGGRAWQVVHVEWSRGVCEVKPTEKAPSARWSGSPSFLGRELCQAMREVLVQEGSEPGWSQRACALIESLRQEHAFLREAEGGRSPMVNEGAGVITWWTFAGGKANLLLARLIEAQLGGKCVSRNTSITCREEAGNSEAALREVVQTLAADRRPSDTDARTWAEAAGGKGRVSKFAPCLPEEMLAAYLAERMMDIDGARAAVDAGAGIRSKPQRVLASAKLGDAPPSR
jgi:ATP-dependent helicase Lhr and Lhr-like helicase